MSDVMEKVEDDIKKHGWHVLSVFSKDAPSFSYSIGFTETLDHPEIIMSGLDTSLMHSLINDIGQLIKNGQRFTNNQLSEEVIKGYPVKNGQRFTNNQLSEEVIKGYPVKFSKISELNKEEYLRAAVSIYSIEKFDAFQCIWPDKKGKFQEESNTAQEVLS